MHTKKLLIIAAAACLPFAATAGEGKDKTGAHGGASFDTLDANRDGRISQAEAAVDASVMFSSADKNSDGYLDKTEWKGRDKNTTTTPQTQSMPDATSPSSDGTQPEAPPSTEPQPDTETPRQ
jgi:hypothetical protein